MIRENDVTFFIRGVASCHGRVAVAKRRWSALWLAGMCLGPSATSAQLETTPFDAQHCPPIPCGAGVVIPIGGCSCLSDPEVTIKCTPHEIKEANGETHTVDWCTQIIKGAPAPLDAPKGCNPEEFAKQLATATGTIQFLTAPPQCGVTPAQCESMPGRFVLHFSNGTSVCTPRTCTQQCVNFGGVEVCSACVSLPIHPSVSVDPNSKTGPAGATDMQFVRGDSPLSYTIHFENLSTATGAAQTVVVTDQLDARQVDFDTFRLGPIAFGDRGFAPAPGARGWTGSTDLGPGQNLVVAMDAGVDPVSGRVTWRFRSIDRGTGQLTDDPDAGFLPPNTTPPAGEGSVTFTVMPKRGLATGTQIRNAATVVFDANAPIPTPTWTNVIDRDPPATHVLPLAAAQTSPTFQVQWTGTDAGSGIGAFTILVSDNGGPFQPWLQQTSATSGMYAGEIGHTYGFASIGADLVGNFEPDKTIPDTSTTVGAVAACAQNVTTSVAITRSGYSYNLVTRRFVQTVTLRNTTASAIPGPIALALDGLTAGVALYNPAGTTACALPAGDPFATTTAGLPPGGTTTLSLQFDNPSRVGIGYVARVLAGTPR